MASDPQPPDGASAPPESPAGELSRAERERYAAALASETWGERAQLRLRGAAIYVIGAGAIGGAAAAHLAAAGAGRLAIVDGAAVTPADLADEPLHFTPDLNANKAESLAAKLGVQNPALHAEPFPAFVDAGNVGAILTGAECVVDCASDRETSLLVNDACVEAGLPLTAGGVATEGGWLTTVPAGASPCLRCGGLPDGASGDRDRQPAPLAGAIGALLGAEALKLVTGAGEPASGVLLLIDALRGAVSSAARPRTTDCICAAR